jgi:hypothetical protein
MNKSNMLPLLLLLINFSSADAMQQRFTQADERAASASIRANTRAASVAASRASMSARRVPNRSIANAQPQAQEASWYRFNPKNLYFALAGIFTAGALANNVIAKADSKNLVFDREKMNKCGDPRENWRVEGYWAPPKFWADCYEGRYPFPKPHTEPFANQVEFLKKLKKIEKVALGKENEYWLKNDSEKQRILPSANMVEVVSYRGLSPSRLEEGVNVGSQEFQDHEHKVIWPGGYRKHYIKKHNVRPSREFYEYVISKKLTEVQDIRNNKV